MADLDQLVARGLISDKAAARMIAGDTLGIAREQLTPSYMRDTPSSPQADQALADPNGMPRKIGPPSGPATAVQVGTGIAGDIASGLAPGGKLAALWPAVKVAQFREMLSAGKSMEEIASAFGITPAAAKALSKAGGVPASGMSDLWSMPGAADTLRNRLAQGRSYRQVAEELGISDTAARSKAAELNIAAPAREPWAAKIKREAAGYDEPGKPANSNIGSNTRFVLAPEEVKLEAQNMLRQGKSHLEVLRKTGAMWTEDENWWVAENSPLKR
jgi:transcriptional regulator with XRE-family HTH domain